MNWMERLHRTSMVKGLVFLFTLMPFYLSCTLTPKDVTVQNTLPPIYPDYCDVTIPENIAPLNFLLRADCEAIEVKAGGLALNAHGNEAVFDIDDWRELMQRSTNEKIEVTVTALIDGKWIQYKPFYWQVVDDRIDPYLTYRLIEPDYEIWNHVQIQQRCVENFDVTAIAHHEQLENRCMNCHTYAHQDPDLTMMYVRGPGGGAILNRHGRLNKLDIPGSVYFCFSPTGRYITYSTQKIIPAFHSDPSKRLEVYDASSNIFVADMQEHRIFTSPQLADSLVFETFPTFSPDGKYIYYCAADTVSLPLDIKRLQYSLVRIPFDERTGTIGTPVDTLLNSQRLKVQGQGLTSVCHPRISPDGRFILYTVADYGTFPIWHPEADLRMTNLLTGQTDSLTIVNSEKSDTYHSWSSNSRWFVFASKRDDGLYGKPYFCYVDKNGRAHKPFCLPQEHPTFYDNNLKSFNAPELGKGKVPFDVDDVVKAMKGQAIQFRESSLRK